MMDEITVNLTREQWERVARLMKLQVDTWRQIPFTRNYDHLLTINRTICEQAGLGEEFRCE